MLLRRRLFTALIVAIAVLGTVSTSTFAGSIGPVYFKDLEPDDAQRARALVAMGLLHPEREFRPYEALSAEDARRMVSAARPDLSRQWLAALFRDRIPVRPATFAAALLRRLPEGPATEAVRMEAYAQGPGYLTRAGALRVLYRFAQARALYTDQVVIGRITLYNAPAAAALRLAEGGRLRLGERYESGTRMALRAEATRPWEYRWQFWLFPLYLELGAGPYLDALSARVFWLPAAVEYPESVPGLILGIAVPGNAFVFVSPESADIHGMGILLHEFGHLVGFRYLDGIEGEDIPARWQESEGWKAYRGLRNLPFPPYRLDIPHEKRTEEVFANDFRLLYEPGIVGDEPEGLRSWLEGISGVSRKQWLAERGCPELERDGYRLDTLLRAVLPGNWRDAVHLRSVTPSVLREDISLPDAGREELARALSFWIPEALGLDRPPLVALAVPEPQRGWDYQEFWLCFCHRMKAILRSPYVWLSTTY